MYRHCHLMLVLMVATGTIKSFVSSTASEEGIQPESEVSEEVQQLDNLRQEHKPSEDKIEISVAPPLAKGQAIFRHRGITEAKKNHLSWDPTNADSDEYAKFSGVQYSPADLAEYVFRTGDEEGVALAVEELVREGMMGRTDAINYLQDVKETLKYMKTQYEQARRLEDTKLRSYPKPQANQRLLKIPREQFVSQVEAEKRDKKIPNSTTAKPTYEVTSTPTPTPKLSIRYDIIMPRPLAENNSGDDNNLAKRPQLATMTERSHAEDSIPSEHTLEEVLYQLAKDIFAQSISREDQTADDTLTRLISFLESEVDNKHTSEKMKEKVLAIISTALVDALREYPRVLSTDKTFHMDNEKLMLYKNTDMDKKNMQATKSNANIADQKTGAAFDLMLSQNPSNAESNRSKRT